jgi:hypothetical protein
MLDLISLLRRGAAPPAGIAIALAVALAGCSGTTYGTGTTPGAQTVQDLAGIALLSGHKREPIDYGPRPKVVLPPAAAQLPAPGADQTASTTPPNWPNDPDLTAARIKADTAAREASGAPLPTLKLPTSALADADKGGNLSGPTTRATTSAPLSAEDQVKVKKLFADARGNSQLDANGKPVRRYLTDPPVDYRVPDPNAPVEFDATTTKKKKFHWFWQKDDSN